MRALVNLKAGGPEVLVVEERPTPEPGPGEVRIAVKRAGLNFADISARVGLYPDAPKFPMVMGYEVSGTVEALGPGVTEPKVGTRVVSICRFGGQASHVVVSAAQALPIPDGMSFDVAAALPVNYLTAYHMLFWVAPLKPGMKVLIHMAAGGVGLAAIQLARTVPDVELFGTASTPKHAMLRAAGVHHPLDSRSGTYDDEVRALTQGKGVHRVLDALGGKDWSKGYHLLAPAGHLLCFGWANMVQGDERDVLHVLSEFLSLRPFTPMGLMDHNRSVSGVNMGHLWGEVELMQHHLKQVLALAADGTIAPHVDSVFPLSRAGEGHTRVQSRQSVGKVLFDCEA
jgi:NADPH:quinone reductase-like Zn-dependent oxidoreductase